MQRRADHQTCAVCCLSFFFFFLCHVGVQTIVGDMAEALQDRFFIGVVGPALMHLYALHSSYTFFCFIRLL